MRKTKEEIIKLYKEGLNRYQIAKKVGTSYSHVWQVIKVYELEQQIKTSPFVS